MKLGRSIKTLKNNLKREPWLAISSILILTLTFLTLNIFILFLAGSGIVLKFLEDKAQISIFFLDSASEEKMLAIKGNLEKDSRIASVNYVSKVDALKIFSEMNKDEPALLESVQSNPLPASLEVKAKKITDLGKLSEEFLQLPGVDDVKFYKDVVDTFRKWSVTMQVAGIILLLVLVTVSVLMVLITIGITIHSKGIEVEILKLVGATDKYVKTPLIMQGMLYGVAAAMLSTVIIFLIMPFVIPVLASLFRGIPPSTGWLIYLKNPVSRVLSVLGLFVIELLLGLGLGFVGSNAAIKKYLRY